MISPRRVGDSIVIRPPRLRLVRVDERPPDLSASLPVALGFVRAVLALIPPIQREYATWDEAHQICFRRALLLMSLEAPSQYRAFKLVSWLGFSHAEAATEIGLPESDANLVAIARWRGEHYLDRMIGDWWRRRQCR